MLAWAAPTANASLSANAPSKLSINASDDRGLARVQFYDDDRLLCEVTAAAVRLLATSRAAATSGATR